jgi:hypothetical protein
LGDIESVSSNSAGHNAPASRLKVIAAIAREACEVSHMKLSHGR